MVKEAFVRTVMFGANLELGLNEMSVFCRKILRVGCFYPGRQSWPVCISSFVRSEEKLRGRRL